MFQRINTLFLILFAVGFFVGEGLFIELTAAEAQEPSIEGAYRLIERRFDDDTIQPPSDIVGLMIFTKNHRSIDVMWTDSEDTFFAYNIVASYELTATEYHETNIGFMMNNIGGIEGIVHDFSSQTGIAPVTVEDGRISFTPPLFNHPPIVFEEDKVTATLEGGVVDTWEKIPSSTEAQALSIEGAYQLIERRFDDDTIQPPSDIVGLMLFTENHRSINVMWTDSEDTFFAYNIAASYELTATEYRETNIGFVMNNIGGIEGIVHDFSSQTATAPVTVEDGRISFAPPLFNHPSIVFEGDKVTATLEGGVIDTWKKGSLTDTPSGFTNDYVFFMSLAQGLNMISLPLKPITPHTARSFAEQLSSTVVVKFDVDRRRFVGFTLDAPGDGFPIEGGKGYIVNLKEATDMTFVGAPWTNEPSVEAAPVAQRELRPPSVEAPDNGWAFVVSGRITDKATDGYLVTIRNTRTNVVATDVVRNGYFAPTFADLSRHSIVEAGDRLQITVMDRNGEIASEPVHINVTADSLRQAFVPITLTNVGKPNRNLLLQNYPNPFNPETWIPYQLIEASGITIQIYDAQSRLVRTLDLGHRAPGFYLSRSRAAYWDGQNDVGEWVASGVYFYQLRAGDFSASRRMLIVK